MCRESASTVPTDPILTGTIDDQNARRTVLSARWVGVCADTLTMYSDRQNRN